MRLQSNLPANLWPELVRTGARLLNRSPVRQLNWRTPIEVLYRALNNSVRIPTLFYARVPGCKVYARIPNIPKLKKMDPRAHIGYLLGYESSNSFRIWIPQRQRVITTRDVTFDEDSIFDPNERLPPLSSEIIEFIELTENPQLDQEIEPTQATQFEMPSLHQEVDLQGTKEQEHHVTTGLLTPSMDTSLSHLTTPDVEPPTTPGSINTATQSQQAPQARRIAPRDINLDISEVNIVSGL